MIPALKAELRKILTVRSTYIVSAAFLALSGFFAFYVDGFKNAPTETLSAIDHAKAQLFIAGNITQIASVISVAGALIALLLLAHEYRYNTIIHTLAAANRRSKVLASKILAVLGFVLVYSAIACAITLALVFAGLHASGHHIPAQQVNYLAFFAKTIFFSEAYAMAALLFIALIRNQVGAIAALFILPNTLEGLLSLLLKQNSVYMPFTALQQVVQPPVIGGISVGARDTSRLGVLSAPKGALVFLAYLVIGWIVAWYLFLKRDAT